jgi:hypothetical protein
MAGKLRADHPGTPREKNGDFSGQISPYNNDDPRNNASRSWTRGNNPSKGRPFR